MRIVLALVLALTLTACGLGPDEDESPEGLLPEPAPTGPVEVLPEPPIDTFEPDLSSPEGVAKAYMAHRHLGQGRPACELLSADLREAFGGLEECVITVENYANDVVYDFEDSLDVSEAISTEAEPVSENQVKVAAALRPNDDAAGLFVEEITVRKTGATWTIIGLASLRSTQENDPAR